MILTIALRSLLARPLRSAILAGGFGLGVSVMVALLGIGEVILQQARSPALAGGGDVVITGSSGYVPNARFLLSSVLQAGPLGPRVETAAPSARAILYLVQDGTVVPLRTRGGIPSLERALGDPETGDLAEWHDTAADRAWAAPDYDDVLRTMDRFHPVPDVPERAGSWAEWLYFNGRSGSSRFYLTFLAGPPADSGRRILGVRLQLDRGGRMTSYSASTDVDEAALLATAPDLTVGNNRVRLVGREYRIDIDLPEDGGPDQGIPGGQPRDGAQGSTTRRVAGELTVQATPGQSLPPITVRGAGGWLSGYVVPVLHGALDGSLHVNGEEITFAGGTAYHDHNWGFWEGVSWRWGQVQTDEISIVYGRLYPPADAADPGRVPGFVAAIGPEGPIGYAADLSIEEIGDDPSGPPDRIVVAGRGASLQVSMDLEIEEATVTRMREGLFGSGLDFFQLRATYRVQGEAGSRSFDFTAPGSAETFRDARGGSND